MEITYGRGGWVSVGALGLPGLLYVRFRLDGGIGELFMESGSASQEPLTAKHLRNIPLAKITVAAMSRPDLLSGPIGDDSPPDVLSLLHGQLVPRRRTYRPTVDTTARLSPPTTGLSDEFLKQVAHAYTAAVARGERPNKSLAEQTRTPQRTVERWVYLARKKKLLPPARPGGVA